MSEFQEFSSIKLGIIKSLQGKGSGAEEITLCHEISNYSLRLLEQIVVRNWKYMAHSDSDIKLYQYPSG
jgi:hypothetical protein